MNRTIRSLITALAATALLVLPAQAGAVTLIEPAAGAHVPWTQTRPSVSFDPATGETPKWILLAIDAEMKQTVRYCRQFTYVMASGGYHWGCNAWAVGADAYGQDVLRPLEWGKTYYAQVVFTKEDKTEATSEVRAFTIENVPASPDPGAVSEQAFASAFGDGTELNLGAAAFVNSGLKSTSIKSFKVKNNRFRIESRFAGGVDLSRSYVQLKSRAGTRNIPLVKYGPNRGKAVWKRNAAERRLTPAKYSYQAFLKSTKNGAMVRSRKVVVLIITTPDKKPPKWTPTA